MILSEAIIDKACDLIEEEQPVFIHKDGIELVMDKPIPYMVLYRYNGSPNRIISKLLRTQACYAIIDQTADVNELFSCISYTISKKFNAFLIIEIWPSKEIDQINVFCRAKQSDPTLEIFKKEIRSFSFKHHHLDLSVKTSDKSPIEPPLATKEQKNKALLWMGISLPDWFGYDESEISFPILYRDFKRHFGETLKKTAFEFIRVQTADKYSHYLMFGKTSIEESGARADKVLADISGRLSLLLNVTPVNEEAAWKDFRSSGYKEAPLMSYRLIRFDPEIVKRQIFSLKLEDINDPTLSFILRQKRSEIEKVLSMMEARETPVFKYIGQSLYGTPDEALLTQAHSLLSNVKCGEFTNDETIDCHEFAAIAQRDIDHYREAFDNKHIDYKIRDDIVGIMVDKSRLYISNTLCISRSRADALIQHEVGTHILTYCNGLRQPLRQMYAGMAGYDELQEGLAVLAEYLVGGLNAARLRLLAARVVAVDLMLKGHTFTDTFHRLISDFEFLDKIAFKITMRIYRGGGFPKDAVYLKGLVDLITYLQNGGDIKILYTGKFNLPHVPLIRELVYRGVLKEPVLPYIFHDERVQKRLDRVRHKDFKLANLVN